MCSNRLLLICFYAFIQFGPWHGLVFQDVKSSYIFFTVVVEGANQDVKTQERISFEPGHLEVPRVPGVTFLVRTGFKSMTVVGEVLKLLKHLHNHPMSKLFRPNKSDLNHLSNQHICYVLQRITITAFRRPSSSGS